MEELVKMSKELEKSIAETHALIDQNNDLQVLIFDMLAYQTKMSLLHDDAGIGEENTMFLNRLREIIGYKRIDGIQQAGSIVGDR